MDHRQFLDILAASMPGKPSPARTSALRQFATKLAIDIPASHLSRDLADAIAPEFTDFPTYDALLRAIRTSPIVPTAGHASSAGAASGREANAWVRLFAGRVAEGADMAKILTIACRHYPSDAWDAIRVQYRDDIRRLVPHLDHEPIPPEERARRFAASQARTLHAAAPPPAGPAVTTRPTFGPPNPRAGADPDILAHYRALAAAGNTVAAVRVAQIEARLSLDA